MSASFSSGHSNHPSLFLFYNYDNRSSVTVFGEASHQDAPYSFITLTAKGKAAAKDVAGRHATLKDFLLNMQRVRPETAEETACRMEHAIDPQTFERLVCFLKYIAECPRAGKEWVRSFQKFCANRECLPADCRKCIDSVETSKLTNM